MPLDKGNKAASQYQSHPGQGGRKQAPGARNMEKKDCQEQPCDDADKEKEVPCFFRLADKSIGIYIVHDDSGNLNAGKVGVKNDVVDIIEPHGRGADQNDLVPDICRRKILV